MARRFSSSRLTTSVPVGAAPMTMSCWAKFTAVSDVYTPFCIGTSGGDNHRWRLYVDAEELVFEARTTTATVAFCTTTPVAGVWMHLCGVEASATSRAVYLNGTGKGTNTTSKVPAGMNLTVIGATATPDDVFGGEIADVAIWRAALTDTEVLWLAQGKPPFQIQPNKLAFYAPLGLSQDVDLVAGRTLLATGTVGLSQHPGQLWLPGSFNQLFGSTHVPLGAPQAKRRPRDRDILNLISAGGFQPAWAAQSNVIVPPGAL